VQRLSGLAGSGGHRTWRMHQALLYLMQWS
jgi:hypothetical protein